MFMLTVLQAPVLLGERQGQQRNTANDTRLVEQACITVL